MARRGVFFLPQVSTSEPDQLRAKNVIQAKIKPTRQ
jgi:hypothetical protein